MSLKIVRNASALRLLQALPRRDFILIDGELVAQSLEGYSALDQFDLEVGIRLVRQAHERPQTALKVLTNPDPAPTTPTTPISP